jgi:hypothetical protein
MLDKPLSRKYGSNHEKRQAGNPAACYLLAHSDIMRFAAAIFVSLLMVGCVHTHTASSRFDSIAKYLTPELIDRHLMNGSAPSPKPDVRFESDQFIADFDGRCMVTIGKGSTFFTEADYQQDQHGFFASILGEGLTPKIGRRAYIAGIEQDIALFATTDGRFDVRIEPRGTPQPVDVVGAAKELSELYDKRAN